MGEEENFVKDVRDFWNSRAGLGQWAGTRDLIAKQLEMEAIASYVLDGMSILDFGCGNGITAIELARRYEVHVFGIDYAEEMINTAKSILGGVELRGQVRFQTGDVGSLSRLPERFNLVYTERTLINLPDWPSQKVAIIALMSLLVDGGVYVMCENSQDGLDKINAFRERIGLARITPPWHNRYLRDAELQQITLPGIALEGINYHSSTYYFLSRVVNAWLAQQEGKEPDYDAPINRLALQLPPYGDTGQGRIWLWRKTG